MLEIISLVCAVALCFWMPAESRKVLGGWKNPRFKGDHAAFLKAHRKQLSLMLGFGIAIGIAMVVIAAITYFEDEDAARAAVKLAIAVVWAAVALVSHRLRARFDAAVAAGSIPAAERPVT
jgi:hypothetical protein